MDVEEQLLEKCIEVNEVAAMVDVRINTRLGSQAFWISVFRNHKAEEFFFETVIREIAKDGFYTESPCHVSPRKDPGSAEVLINYAIDCIITHRC